MTVRLAQGRTSRFDRHSATVRNRRGTADDMTTATVRTHRIVLYRAVRNTAARVRLAGTATSLYLPVLMSLHWQKNARLPRPESRAMTKEIRLNAFDMNC